MRFEKSADRTPFVETPDGTWPARLYSVVDLGTQQGGTFKGETKKDAKKVVFQFEVYAEPTLSEGRPYLSRSTFTFSNFHKSNLMKFLSSWRGAPMEEEELLTPGFLKKLLGKPCLLSLAKSAPNALGKTYVNITACIRLPRGMEVPPLVNATSYFDLDEFDPRTFDALSPWLKKSIEASPEYRMLTQTGYAKSPPKESASKDYDDEIPF